jgi:hypothetical protein
MHPTTDRQGMGRLYVPSPLTRFISFHILSPMIDPDIVTVLRAVPEFAERYLDLVEAADGDPGAAVAFTELADFAADLADEMGRRRPTLERCLAAVEEVAASSPEARQHVGWAFLDSLSPEEARGLAPMMGPCTRALLDEIDLGSGGDRAAG